MAVCVSEEGEVFVWDVRSSKCLKRFEDEGCVRGTSLALSGDGSYLACGWVWPTSGKNFNKCLFITVVQMISCLWGASEVRLNPVVWFVALSLESWTSTHRRTVCSRANPNLWRPSWTCWRRRRLCASTTPQRSWPSDRARTTRRTDWCVCGLWL